MDLHIEVSEVVFVGNSADARHSGILQASAGPFPCSCSGSEAWETCGSAMRRSVSLTIRFGRAAMTAIEV